MSQETAVRMGHRITFQDYRHIAIAIDREHVRGLMGDDDDDDVDDAHDLGAAHSSRTADLVYGLDISMLRALSARSINVFRKVSDRWHHFLHENSRQQWPDRGRSRALSGTALLPEKKRQRLCANSDKQAELQQGLEKLLGAGASFRSREQREAILAVMRGQSPLVVVLPPSGGKSLVFQLPASLQDAKSTVVVVPFVALVGDLKKRCRDLGMGCVQWTAENQQRATIVLVVSEAAASKAFIAWASGLQLSGKLDRIVIDECHVLLTAAEYRHRLQDLDHLRAIPCQFVLLTGTLPPRMERELGKALLLGSEDDGLRWIRARTDRRNIAFMVTEVEDGEEIATVCKVISEAQGKQLSKGLTVVFCGDRAGCEEIAMNLGCQPYHAKWREKEQSLASWRRADERVIVATSALGTGVDVAGIELVLHVGRPHSALDFVQEVGRAGRSGEAVQSVVVMRKREMRWLRSEGAKNSNPSKEALRRFLTTRDCRRLELMTFMDGHGESCNKAEAERCDVCQQEVRGTRLGEDRKQEREEIQQEDMRTEHYEKGPKLL